VLLNKEGEIEIGKELKEFKEFAGEFPPEVRGAVCLPHERVANMGHSCAERRCRIPI
jgi:hypothetical protein